MKDIYLQELEELALLDTPEGLPFDDMVDLIDIDYIVSHAWKVKNRNPELF